jgi:hypothetical protein
MTGFKKSMIHLDEVEILNMLYNRIHLFYVTYHPKLDISIKILEF